jgi:membrane associated rhomboid family serine protease
LDNAYRPPSAFSMMPPVVKNLLIINGLVFLAQWVADLREPGVVFNMIDRWFALWPIGGPDAIRFLDGVMTFESFQPWQLLTSAFLHANLSHILFNMFGLWMFGMRIENTLGSRRFLWFYLACVLGASLLQLGVTSWPFLMGDGGAIPTPTLGASGGVLGVLAAFGLLYPEERIYLYFLFPIPAKWFVLGLAALDLFGGFSATQSGIAHFAHLGGMAVGALAVLYWAGRLPVQPRSRLL